ncbi:hypothetical protein AVEN_158893-1 [Araneus ventricosus]|uniref:Uncharacterized protein n=1 Tax=Araneus ventricosus TaxID=182803 RepID=A0A4Y2B9Q0_ARAVE|nr:hypothetical protein AVEN_158893-1 [Araneus ventricosus]
MHTPNTADLWWNRVANLQRSSLEADTLPLGHRRLARRRQLSIFLQCRDLSWSVCGGGHNGSMFLFEAEQPWKILVSCRSRLLLKSRKYFESIYNKLVISLLDVS